jgi:hypothetical protein
MTPPASKGLAPSFARRPGDPDAWVRADDRPPVPISPTKAEVYDARLTLDITKALRGRIKVAAFKRGETVADMLRVMLEAAFPEEGAGS